MSEEEWLFHNLESNCRNVLYQEDALYFPDIELRLHIRVISTEKHRIQTLFIFTHPDFFELMLKSLSGYGESLLEQL